MHSNLCDVVVVWVFSSGFCSNWTSRTDHGNLHWSRNYLIVEGIQSHRPIALYIVYVYQMYAEASKSYCIEFPLQLNATTNWSTSDTIPGRSHQIKIYGQISYYCVRTNSRGIWKQKYLIFTGYEIVFEIISGEYWCFSEARRRFTFMNVHASFPPIVPHITGFGFPTI